MKTFTAILLILAVMLCVQKSAAQSVQPMTVAMTGFRNTDGQAMIFLYNNAADFPTKRDRAFRVKKVPVTGAAMEVMFDDIPAGTYGVAVYHDENKNDKMDRAWYGMPTEGYGASNDAKGTFGPPKFDDAKFEMGNAPKTVKINIHY